MEEKELTTSEQAVVVDDTLPPKITKADLDAVKTTKKGKIMFWIRVVVYTILSSFLIAFAAHSLITPNNFTIGGISSHMPRLSFSMSASA